MDNKLSFAMILILAAFVACTALYESFSSRLYPVPEISQDAQIGFYQNGGELMLVFSAETEHTEIVLLYYACRFPDGWRVDRKIYDVYPIDGEITHRHPANCPGRIRIILKAYNNFQKRSQKTARMGWEFDVKTVMRNSDERRTRWAM